MYLDYLKGVAYINGMKLEDITEKQGEHTPDFMLVDHQFSGLYFKLHNGELLNGNQNGCHPKDIIALVTHIIEKMNEDCPTKEDTQALYHLNNALKWLGPKNRAFEESPTTSRGVTQ